MNMTAEKSAPLDANITLPRAAIFVDWLVGLWRDKGIEVRRSSAERVSLTLADVGTVELHILSARQLQCSVVTSTAQMGEAMQLSLTEYLGEFADEMLWPEDSWNIHWNGQAPRSPARLHVMQVIGNHALTPRMRRLRLKCNDIRAFVDGGLHVRMLLPLDGQAPIWPALLGDGRLQWPAGKPRMPRRTYTIRAHDAKASWLDVDVLLHCDVEGTPPGSHWAETAQLGSSVGVLSPAGGVLPSAVHHVLVADACALPAAARMVQMMSRNQTVSLLLWVADADEMPAFDVPDSMVQPNWMFSAEPGASEPEIAQVLEWLSQQDYQNADTLLWVASGLPLTQAVRRWAANRPQLAGVRTLIHTYWR